MTKRAPGRLLPALLPLLAASLAAAALRRDRGVPDARAHVGRVFKLQLPGDAFRGRPQRYQVTEAGEDALPKWLQFDPNQHIFTGVAASSDAGQLYICIKAIENDSIAKDVFSIEVVEDASETEDCPFGQAETVAAIVLDATLSDLQPTDKLRILQSLASHLDLPESTLRLAALHRDESSLDPGAVRAGPGDALQRGSDGVRALFGVGCGGAVAHPFEPVLEAVERDAASGELADAAGHPVVGWQVAGGGPAPPRARERRNVTPFRPTPVPRLHLTRWPSRTERVEEAGTREAVPEVRIVPTPSSPLFAARATADHRHRHHHGQDPLRREHLPPVPEIAASPTYRYRPLPTTRPGGTALPTPVPQPGRPTVAVLPTRVYDIDGTISLAPERPPPASGDVLSRRYDVSTDASTADIRPTGSRATVEPTRLMPQTPNFKPTVNSRIKKLSLVAGKAWTYQIPLDTFIDIEDGNTRDLRLIFKTSEHASLPSHSWIQLDPEKQMMYALPLNENIGKHEFVLEAMDSEGASTFDRVELHVWQHPQIDILSHSFTMTVRYNKWQYPVGIDWQIEMLSRLAHLFGDPDNSKLCVLSVTLDPIKLTWTNDTLPTEVCPLEQIQYIYDMIATAEHHPTKKMKKIMESEFRVQDFSVSYRGACQGLVTTQPPALNFAPRLRNPIKRINVTVGDIVKHKIPDDTFYDFEDGSTRHLRLTLLTAGHIHPPPSYWLQFDSRSQEIYGLPSESDIGRHDFFLNAMDSDGHSVSDNFVIHVYRIPRRKKPPVELSILIDYDFDDFNADTSKKTLVASKLARLYGDPGPQYMMITNITRGSIVYAWSNKTLGNDYCPKDKIDQLVKYLIHDDGTLAPGLLQIMEPEFRVISADAVPTGVCLGGVPPTFVTITTTTPQPSPPPGELEPTLRTSTDDDIYITTIVPAAVIAVMLVIAAVVAYLLYWKKRKGKMSLGDKDFIGSGVPVVFAGELEEQKPDPGKAPAIMRNEKPPLSTDHLLLGPLRRVTAAVRDAAGRDDTAPKLAREPRDASTLYKPPPPFPSSREGKGTRPKSTQAYRHATYVPP